MTDISTRGQRNQAPEQRSLGRAKISGNARLRFNARRRPVDCGLRDLTSAGAGIRVDRINIIPVNFELSFDNFHTTRPCRLIWREGDFVGVAFRN
jgi:hypothetical protein